jgi:uncharacterized RDD family membrane protein YckC
LQLERPEAVPTSHDPADVVGRRIGAALIDVALMVLLFILLGIALGEGEASDDGASVSLEGGGAVLFFVLMLGYYFATEAAWGQTLGKRLLGLKVVRADGSTAGPGPVAGRTLLRVVDILPALYLLGLIVMLATQRKQRIGDLAAGTVVATA